LKDMLKQIEEQESGSKLIASFFFNARGAELERRSLGLFRSLLHQILYQCRERLDEFLKDHWKKKHDQGAPVRWHTRELADFIRSTFSTVKMKSTILFVDALDECEGDGMRELVYFFRDLTTFAYAAGAQLNVCLSSRLYPTVTIQLCPELVVEDFNGADIAQYVRRKLAASINNDGDDWSQIERTILEKSSGVFLWVVLVADVLLRHRDEGRNFKSLERTLQRVPAALEDLFEQLLKGLSTNEVGVTVDFFRWVLLAARPLRLNEWHHVLGFISDRRPGSLREWRESDDHIENNDQLERRIRVISRGLVEVKKTAQQQLHAYYLDDDSVHAGAGSLDAYQDEVGGIQFIHESVREYFLTGKGFKLLNPLMGPCPLGQGHMFLFNTCLRYLHISELDALVSRRIELGSQTAASTPLSAYFLEWKEEGKFDGTFDVKCLGLKWPIKEKAQRRNRRGIQKRTMSMASFGSSASYIARSNHSAPVVGASESPSADPDAAPHDRDEMLKRYLASTEASPRKLPEGPVQSIISQIRPNMSIASEEFPDPPPDSPTRSASPIPSTTGFSIVLDELPALLSYSVDMLFTHASLAEAEGFTDVYSIIAQLSVLGGWQRWLALKEDLSTRTTLLYYVCERNLLSWVRALLRRRVWLPAHRGRQRLSRKSGRTAAEPRSRHD
jgi:protein SERAC1